MRTLLIGRCGFAVDATGESVSNISSSVPGGCAPGHRRPDLPVVLPAYRDDIPPFWTRTHEASLRWGHRGALEDVDAHCCSADGRRASWRRGCPIEHVGYQLR